jgi:hypothetical protein
VVVGKEDPLGTGRAPQDQGKALASASTLNRLEPGNNKKTRCHKTTADHEAIEDTLFLTLFRSQEHFPISIFSPRTRQIYPTQQWRKFFMTQRHLASTTS